MLARPGREAMRLGEAAGLRREASPASAGQSAFETTWTGMAAAEAAARRLCTGAKDRVGRTPAGEAG